MFLFCLLLSHLINGIAADTEIINFSATAAESYSLPFTETWSVQILLPALSSLTSSYYQLEGIFYDLEIRLCNGI